MFRDCFDIVKDECAYSKSSVLFRDTQARHAQAFVIFLDSKQPDNFSFQFNKIAGKSEEDKRVRLSNVKH